MDGKRREFLKKAAAWALGAGCGLPLLRAGVLALEGNPGTDQTSGLSPNSPAKQWAMVVDLEKCLQEPVRRACIEACHREHNVPEIPDPKHQVKWIRSANYENAFPDQSHPHDDRNGTPVLVLCNHCREPACVKVCPTQATWKRGQDGIVMMDMHRCIGCRYCMAACPYGARSFNWRDPRPYLQGGVRPSYPTRSKGVVEKCTFCDERIRRGALPACVEAARAVPGGEGALTFGDLSDPDSDVSRILRRKHTLCRKVSAGTGPNVFYLG
jgi:molybdopterin-containing oxidoreductase family iron-sulfur binding subunit